MDLDDERKAAGRSPPEAIEGKRKAIPADEDLLSDVEFDLLDEEPEVEEPDHDVFARDTAIPASPPEQLAAEAMRQADAGEVPPTRGRALPRVPPPPPMRSKPQMPITLEPPSEDLEFDNFDAPIDVFGNQLPGTAPRRARAQNSELPTAPPNERRDTSEDDKRTNPAPQRVNRAAFLAETTRNRPIDPALLASVDQADANGRATGSGPARDSDFGLEFSEELDPLLDELAPTPESAPPRAPARSLSAQDLEESYAAGDYNRALMIAEDLLARSPDDRAARRYVQNCREVLTQMFAARIGPLDQVVSILVKPEEVQWLSLDHRAGFLLSLVDGQSTVDEILDISGMSRLDALKIIFDLTSQQVVRLA